MYGFVACELENGEWRENKKLGVHKCLSEVIPS